MKIKMVKVKGKHDVINTAFTEDMKYVRLADAIALTNIKAGYTIATTLDEMGYGVSEQIEDSAKKTHKYIEVERTIQIWKSDYEKIAKRRTPAVLSNMRSFMTSFTGIMEELYGNKIESVLVEQGEVEEPTPLGLSIDIIMNELSKIEHLKDTTVECNRRIEELLLEIDKLRADNRMYQQKFNEIKHSCDEISKQRDSLIGKNQDLIDKNKRLIRALEA